jgi:hypothetical protein
MDKLLRSVLLPEGSLSSILDCLLILSNSPLWVIRLLFSSSFLWNNFVTWLFSCTYIFSGVYFKQVKTSISSLFEEFAKNETHSNCSKVQDLLINVLQCLVENKCICSQSTEKLNCSSQDENISVGTNMESGDTLKLPSTDTSKNQEGNQGWFCQ